MRVKMFAMEKADNLGCHKFGGLLPKTEEVLHCGERLYPTKARRLQHFRYGCITRTEVNAIV